MPVHYETSGGIAVITFDNHPLNVMGQSMRAALNDAIERAESDGVHRVILTGTGRCFVAGADAKEFGGPALAPHLNDVLAKLSALTMPTIAAINGTALGAGMEIALACRYRIADPKAVLGLPEVTLGIVPGAGGTQRLPRIIGIAAAVDIIGQGKTIDVASAEKLGLVDKTSHDPVAEARMIDEGILKEALPTDLRPAPTQDLAAIEMAHADANKRATKQNAPHVAIDLVGMSATAPLVTAFEKERAAFLDLRASGQARALRHVFFAERAALSLSKSYFTNKDRIETAVVVGGGTMGSAIAYALACAGIKVTLVEINKVARKRARSNVQSLISKGVARGAIKEQASNALFRRFSFLIGYEDLPEADLAIEAAFEDLDVKRDILNRLQDALPVDAILATNTSYMDVNKLAEGVRNPERFLGLHFFAPAHVMKLLEIIRSKKTSKQTLGISLTLARQLNKISVLSGVCDGFIGNRILKRYRHAADILLLEGATPGSVDTAMRSFGMAMGPYRAQDLSGLDIAYANRQRHDLRHQSGIRYVPIADHLVENLNRLGRKTGAGWYDYDEKGKTLHSDQVTQCLIEASQNAGVERRSVSKKDISNQLVMAMIAEALDILEEGIADKPGDIDLVLIHGYGFPRWRGGLMHYAHEFTSKHLLTSIKEYRKRDPLSWHVPNLLQKLVDTDRSIDDLNFGPLHTVSARVRG